MRMLGQWMRRKGMVARTKVVPLERGVEEIGMDVEGSVNSIGLWKEMEKREESRMIPSFLSEHLWLWLGA